MHTENYKTWLKDTEEDLNKWKTDHVYGLENLLRSQYFPHTATNSMYFLSKLQQAFFAEMDKLSLNLCSNSRGTPLVAKTVLKKNKAGRLMLSKFKIYCKATVNKCGLGIRIQTNGIESRVHKQTQTSMVNWFLTRVLR